MGGRDPAVQRVADRGPGVVEQLVPPACRHRSLEGRERPFALVHVPRADDHAPELVGREPVERREDLVDPLAGGPVGRIGEPVGLDHVRLRGLANSRQIAPSAIASTMPMTG